MYVYVHGYIRMNVCKFIYIQIYADRNMDVNETWCWMESKARVVKQLGHDSTCPSTTPQRPKLTDL